MKKKSFSRDERKVMIVTWFAIRVQKGNEKYATMPAIARGLGLEPSTHIANMLKEMCADGVLHSLPFEKSGRWDGSQYMLQEGTFDRPKARVIPVKARGVESGQLELRS